MLLNGQGLSGKSSDVLDQHRVRGSLHGPVDFLEGRNRRIVPVFQLSLSGKF